MRDSCPPLAVSLGPSRADFCIKVNCWTHGLIVVHRWTNGKVIFASGSPFGPVVMADGSVISPAQANNAYIFPPIGHAASLAKWPSISDDVFLLAAESLAAMTTPADVATGRLFPPFNRIMDVSADIMAHLLHELPPPAGTASAGSTRTLAEWRAWVKSHMWRPSDHPSTSSKL